MGAAHSCICASGAPAGPNPEKEEEDDDPVAAVHAALDRVVARAELRMGALPVRGRCRRLPQRIEDDYIIEEEALGSGYSGTVFAARGKHNTSEAVAVKTFQLCGIAEESHTQELANEVEIILSMDHPNVVRLMEVYKSDFELSLVMERMEGGDVFSRVSQVRVFTEREAACAARHMLRAVNYIHHQGIVHRDLKLENFMYDQQGSDFIKLIDFGFSKFFQRNEVMEDSLGTINYVAPEVLAKRYSCGSCDLWSLGVIVFILLSGYMPFNGRELTIVRAIRSGRYRMLQSRWGGVSQDARDFVKRLLEVEPSRRLTAKAALSHPWLAKACAEEQGLSPSLVSDVGHAFSCFAQVSRFRQACMQMLAWSLSSDERRKLRATFLALDRSNTGVLKLKDLRAFFKRELRLPRNDLAHVVKTMRELDVGNDGDLHYSDFLAAMLAPRLGTGDDSVLRDAFWRFDVDHCGYLTKAQLQRVLGSKVSPVEMERIFSAMDSNQDRQITMDEFAAYVFSGTGGSSCSGNQADTVSGSAFAGKFAAAGMQSEIARRTLLGRLRLPGRLGHAAKPATPAFPAGMMTFTDTIS